eukprot:Sspe_Gene.66091::Locus_39069_Transcript_1_1_Confidence_1.000_Length_4239::g.66091::m.66091
MAPGAPGSWVGPFSECVGVQHRAPRQHTKRAAKKRPDRLMPLICADQRREPTNISARVIKEVKQVLQRLQPGHLELLSRLPELHKEEPEDHSPPADEMALVIPDSLPTHITLEPHVPLTTSPLALPANGPDDGDQADSSTFSPLSLKSGVPSRRSLWDIWDPSAPPPFDPPSPTLGSPVGRSLQNSACFVSSFGCASSPTRKRPSIVMPRRRSSTSTRRTQSSTTTVYRSASYLRRKMSRRQSRNRRRLLAACDEPDATAADTSAIDASVALLLEAAKPSLATTTRWLNKWAGAAISGEVVKDEPAIPWHEETAAFRELLQSGDYATLFRNVRFRKAIPTPQPTSPVRRESRDSFHRRVSVAEESFLSSRNSTDTVEPCSPARVKSPPKKAVVAVPETPPVNYPLRRGTEVRIKRINLDLEHMSATLSSYMSREERREAAISHRNRVRVQRAHQMQSEMWCKALAAIPAHHAALWLGLHLARSRLSRTLGPLLWLAAKRRWRRRSRERLMVHTVAVPPMPMEMLTALPFLSAWPVEWKERLLLSFQLVVYSPGDVIQHQNSVGSMLHVVAKGDLALVRHPDWRSKRKNPATAIEFQRKKVGDAVCEVAFLGKLSPEPATVYVPPRSGVTVCYVIPNRVLQHFLVSIPVKARAFSIDVINDLRTHYLKRALPLEPNLFRAHALLGHWSEQQLVALPTEAEYVTMKKGTVWNSGDVVDGMYLLTRGIVESEGSSLRPGALFGVEELVFFGVPRMTHVVAHTDIEAWFISKKHYYSVGQNDPLVLWKTRSQAMAWALEHIPRPSEALVQSIARKLGTHRGDVLPALQPFLLDTRETLFTAGSPVKHIYVPTLGQLFNPVDMRQIE